MKEEDGSPKIYLLPNLMTAGNLFCGFLATLKILQGALESASRVVEVKLGGAVMAHAQALDAGNAHFKFAIGCILVACLFDLLDGRLARLGGTDSAFGREFDSLADIVSFGVAPALMVSRVVLRDFELGWLVASIYLICGAMRLARFNCIAAANAASASKEFKGFPIPAAAGLVASITLFMLYLTNDSIEHWLMKWILPPLLLFLSWMMFSGFKYPSFKNINWRTRKSLPVVLGIITMMIVTWKYYQWMLAVIFISYLLYGFLRPFLSRRIKENIEDEIDDDDLEADNNEQSESPR